MVEDVILKIKQINQLLNLQNTEYTFCTYLCKSLHNHHLALTYLDSNRNLNMTSRFEIISLLAEKPT